MSWCVGVGCSYFLASPLNLLRCCRCFHLPTVISASMIRYPPSITAASVYLLQIYKEYLVFMKQCLDCKPPSNGQESSWAHFQLSVITPGIIFAWLSVKNIKSLSMLVWPSLHPLSSSSDPTSFIHTLYIRDSRSEKRRQCKSALSMHSF